MRACLPHYQSARRARFHWKWENWFWFEGLTLKFRHPLRRRRKSDGLTDGLLNASRHKSNNTRGSALVLNAVNSSLGLFRFRQMDERIGHGPIYSPWIGCVSGWMRSWRRRWRMADWLTVWRNCPALCTDHLSDRTTAVQIAHHSAVYRTQDCGVISLWGVSAPVIRTSLHLLNGPCFVQSTPAVRSNILFLARRLVKSGAYLIPVGSQDSDRWPTRTLP